MTLCLTIFLLAMIVQGLSLIFNKDMGWRAEETRARRRGVYNLERTRQGEIQTTAGGIIIIVIAAILLSIVITQG